MQARSANTVFMVFCGLHFSSVAPKPSIAVIASQQHRIYQRALIEFMGQRISAWATASLSAGMPALARQWLARTERPSAGVLLHALAEFLTISARLLRPIGKVLLHLGYVDVYRTTFGAGVKRGRDNFDPEASADQPFGEDRVWAGGPEEGASVRFERAGELQKTLETVEAGVLLLDHGRRAIVGIQHQDVVLSGFRACDDCPDIAQHHFNPWVVQQPSVQMGQEITIPIDDLWDDLCDLHFRSGTAPGAPVLPAAQVSPVDLRVRQHPIPRVEALRP